MSNDKFTLAKLDEIVAYIERLEINPFGGIYMIDEYSDPHLQALKGVFFDGGMTAVDWEFIETNHRRIVAMYLAKHHVNAHSKEWLEVIADVKTQIKAEEK